MATISQDKLQELLKNAPAGMGQDEIMRGLQQRGVTVEPTSPMQSGQQANRDMDNNQTGGVFDPIGSISKTAQAVGSGVADMIGGAAEAINPFSGADFGQRAQSAGKALLGGAKAVFTAGTAPIQPVIQEASNMLERAPSALKNAPESIANSFSSGISRTKEGLEKLSRGEVFTGGLRSAAGGIATVFSPMAPIGELLPPQIGQAIGGSVDYVKNITGIKGTENEKVFDDMLEIGMTLIPGGAGKAAKGVKSPLLRSVADSVSLQKPLLQKVTNLMEKPFPNAKSLNTKKLLTEQAKLGGFTQLEKTLNTSLLPKIKQYVQEKAAGDLTTDNFSSFIDDVSTKQREMLDAVVRNSPGMLTTFDRTAQTFASTKGILGDASLPPKFSNRLQGFSQLLEKGGVTMNDMTSLLNDFDKYALKKKYAPQREFLQTARTSIINDLQDTIMTTMPKLGQSLSYFDEIKNSVQSFVGSDIMKKVQTYAENGMKEQDAIIKAFSDTPSAIRHMDDMTRSQVESAVWQKIFEDSTVDGVLDPRSFFKNTRKYSASPAFALLGDQAKYSVQLFSKLGEHLSTGLGQIDEVMATILGKAQDVNANVVTSAKNITKSTGENITSKVFGADFEDIMAGYNNPELAQLHKTGALNPFEKITSFFNEVRAKRSGTAQEYAPIREANQAISLPPTWMDEVLKEKFKLNITKKGIEVGAESLPLTTAEANKLFEEVVKFKGANTAQSFFTLRDRTGRLADFDQKIGKSDTLERVSRELYARLNEIGRPQIKGLEKLDKPLSEATKLLNDPVLKGRLFDKNGQLKAKFDGDDIVSLLNKSNKGTLTKIEQLIPGITEELKMMKAIEKIMEASRINKPGNYVSAGKAFAGASIGGSFGGLFGAGLGLAAGLAITPELAFNIASYFGRKNARNSMKIPRFVPGTNVSLADDVVLPDSATLSD